MFHIYEAFEVPYLKCFIYMKHVRHLALPAGQRRAHDGQGPVRLQEARLWYLHVNARLRSALAGAVAQKARIYEPLGVPYLNCFVYMKHLSYGTPNASYIRAIGSAVAQKVRIYEALGVP